MAQRALGKPIAAKSAATHARVLSAAAAKPKAQALGGAETSSVRTAKPPRLPKLGGLSADQQVAVLLRERQTLAAQVAKADARVAALEARQVELAERISWALDTLDDLLKNRT